MTDLHTRLKTTCVKAISRLLDSDSNAETVRTASDGYVIILRTKESDDQDIEISARRLDEIDALRAEVAALKQQRPDNHFDPDFNDLLRVDETPEWTPAVVTASGHGASGHGRLFRVSGVESDFLKLIEEVDSNPFLHDSLRARRSLPSRPRSECQASRPLKN